MVGDSVRIQSLQRSSLDMFGRTGPQQLSNPCMWTSLQEMLSRPTRSSASVCVSISLRLAINPMRHPVLSEGSIPTKGTAVAQGAGTHRVAQTPDEAKELVRIIHHRAPEWKLPECIKAFKLNAQPPDLEQMAN